MALSVHRLRDMAHIHDQAAMSGLAGLRNRPAVRRIGRLLLRGAFVLIATLSLALLMWAIVSSATHRSKPAEQEPNARMRTQAPPESASASQPKNALERFNASVASWTSGFLGNFRKSTPAEVSIDKRDLAGGVDLSRLLPKAGPLPSSQTQGGLDASKLRTGETQPRQAGTSPEASRAAALSNLAGPATPAQSQFREVRNGRVLPPAPASGQPASQPAREVALRTETRGRTPPASVPASTPDSPAPATARAAPLSVAASAPAPDGRNARREASAEETAAAAIRAAQADFRKFESARQAIDALLARNPDVGIRSLYEGHMATLIESRGKAITERAGADPRQDKFQAAGVDDSVSIAIAACLQGIAGLESAVLARKSVSMQPLIPAYVLVAGAPSLPKGALASEAMAARLNACMGSLHAIGTAVLVIAAPATGGQDLFEKLSRTDGALVWRKS